MKINYKKAFKRFSSNVQFIAALLALPGYFISAYKLTGNFTYETTKPATGYDIPICKFLNPFYSVVLFVSVYIMVFILWNIVITKIGHLVRFVKWPIIYRWSAYALIFLILMTGCEFTYRLFWGGSFM